MFGSLAPNSQIVQTDEDFLAPFRLAVEQAKMPQLDPAAIEALNGKRTQDAGRLAWDMAQWFSPTMKESTPGLASFFQQGVMNGDLNQGLYNSFAKATGYSGPSLNQIQNYDPSAAQSAMAGAAATAGATSLEQAQAALDNAIKTRQENAQRQQQAYGQMQGGNYFGGMTTEAYSDPMGNPGQGNPGGLGGLGGMTNEWGQSWSPDKRQLSAGQWGTPFKW